MGFKLEPTRWGLKIAKLVNSNSSLGELYGLC